MNKLLEFQKRVEAIKKDSKNPFFKSSYLSLNGLLDAIKPLLNELELVLIQPLNYADGRPAITTTIFDGDKKLVDTTIILPDLQDPQKMGSAITYYRRYAIQSMLCLQATDDDAETVVRQAIKQVSQDESSIRLLNTKSLPDKRKETIIDLCKKLGFTGETAKEYNVFVFSKTTHVLKEENFDLIIDKLNKLIK